MTENTKKWLTVAGCLVVCAILVAVIASSFSKDKVTDDLLPPSSSQQGDVVVDPGTPEPQDHNNVTPPPEQPSTNTSGGLPGFDNVPNAGANQGGSIDSDGDINTQVGIMG